MVWLKRRRAFTDAMSELSIIKDERHDERVCEIRSASPVPWTENNIDFKSPGFWRECYCNSYTSSNIIFRSNKIEVFQNGTRCLLRK